MVKTTKPRNPALKPPETPQASAAATPPAEIPLETGATHESTDNQAGANSPPAATLPETGSDAESTASQDDNKPPVLDDGLVECEVLSPLDHDNHGYEIGSKVRLSQEQINRMPGTVAPIRVI